MSKVQFKRGLREQMPTVATKDTLLFSTNTSEIFMGTGTGISKMGDVYSGYTDLADLQTKVPQGITGKLYLTNDSKLYTFQNGLYSLVAGSSSPITSFEADKVTYNNTGSTLVSNNTQSAINELDSKVEMNRAENNATKSRVDALESDNTTNKADIADLKTKEGLVKLDANDTSAYLGEKLDGATVVVENNKIVVKSIEGLTIATTQLNLLDGTTTNVQGQLDALDSKINATSSGMSFGGVQPDYASLSSITSPANGTLVVVAVDETKDDARTSYIYNEATSTWDYYGTFDMAEGFLDLTDTPNAYQDGKVLKSTDSGIVMGDVDWSEITNKPTSSITDIDSSVAKAHEHVNVDTLNKLGEDTEGNLTFDGKSLKTEILWEEFNI